LCEKSGAIALLLPGLTASWLADKIVLNVEIFKIIYWMKYIGIGTGGAGGAIAPPLFTQQCCLSKNILGRDSHVKLPYNALLSQ